LKRERQLGEQSDGCDAGKQILFHGLLLIFGRLRTPFQLLEMLESVETKQPQSSFCTLTAELIPSAEQSIPG
jgi:hypothetical protein